VKLPIYLDNHATTPVDPRVFDAMTPYFLEKFGNAASSSHAFGWDARAGVEQARNQVAALIGAKPNEIIFTSGATESDNLAVKGAAWMLRDAGKPDRNHIITCATEHKAVLDSCCHLQKEGFRVTVLPVDRYGQVQAADVEQAIEKGTILVSLMAANNEVGTLHPIGEIGRLCRERGILFHSDATQMIGRLPFDVNALNVDIAALTAHKFYGPKGSGAIFVRESVKLAPLVDGGGHERGMRSGTMNVPGIVGLGKACELARLDIPAEAPRLLALRDRLREGIFSQLDNVYLNGHPTERLPGNLNVSFGGVDGQSLTMGLHQIAVSSGAACSSALAKPSHVLEAIGISDELAESTLRFGVGRFNTEEEIDFTIARVVETVAQLRELSTGLL
jgi:cysteine desulfurase